MFGLFKKKVPAAMRATIEMKAREAASHIVGQTKGTRYHVKNGVIDFGRNDERQQLLAAFGKRWSELSKNRERWPEQIQENLRRFGGADASVYDQAAALLLTGVLQTDTICRVACEYPDDADMRAFAFRLLTTNLGAFDAIMSGQGDIQFGDPRPSTELLGELQYSNALFEKHAGFR